MCLNLRGLRGWTLVFGLWLLWAGLGAGGALGQGVSREYPLKAVFLLNFAHYTRWPTNAFEHPDSPFVIGVYGEDPFGPLLDDVVRDETQDGRKIVVARYRRGEAIGACHILFVGQPETRRLDKVLADLKGRPVLTVRDVGNAPYEGMCVQFLTENNKIRLRISPQALKAADLTMSSKLLRTAELVPPDSR